MGRDDSGRYLLDIRRVVGSHHDDLAVILSPGTVMFRPSPREVVMEDTLETVVFLANSANRVRVLEVLARTRATRGELAAETGIARSTLGRVLTDLEQRNWVVEDGGEYASTPQGQHLVAAFQELCDTVVVLDELGPLVEWFPTDDVSFDLGRLRDATVVKPDAGDAIRPVTRSLSLIQSAERIRLLAPHYAAPAIDAFWEGAVREERLDLELIVTQQAAEAALGDPDSGDRWRDLAAADRAALYVVDSLPPYNCAANDETIVIALSDDNAAPQALVESTDPEVRAWFDDRFAAVRERAQRLTPDDLE